MTAVVQTERPAREPIDLPALPAPPSSGLAFGVFLAVNATLFVRPGEVIPAVEGWNIFLVLILINLVLALPSVLYQLSPGVLDQRPITTCVLGLLAAVVLSHLAHGWLMYGADRWFEFFKTVVYYLLLLSLVDSPKRLRAVVLCTLFCASIMVFLAVLDFHKVIALPKMQRSLDHPEYTAKWDDTRLSGTGLFQDPNELCVLIATVVPLGLYALADKGLGPLRVLALGSLGLFLYGFSKTQSRGGLLALGAGLAGFVRIRYGWGKTLLLGAMGVPVLLLMVSGRQAELSTQTGTAHTRLMLWSDGLDYFREAPLFGIGEGEFGNRSKHVAHNSYLHAFAELGGFGGLFFLGIVYLPLSAMYRLCTHNATILDPQMRQLHPYLFGALAAYAAGMFSLTLCFVMPTFAVMGMGAIFVAVTATQPRLLVEKVDTQLVVRLTVVGFCFLVFIYLFVRFFKG